MRILITGGAGFIGCNLAQRLLQRGHTIIVYDNLSRRGTSANLNWLHQVAQSSPGKLEYIHADIRYGAALMSAARETHAIFHLAGQVAVTQSVQDPATDFAINAQGTFNVLEAARLAPHQPIVIYASTNKVYGGMEDVAIVEAATRYQYRDLPNGVPETRLLDFHSPYGCSKGAGDQYVRDYHRIYGLKTVVFRQSCLAASQPVVTPFGLKPICVLRTGDLVHSGAGWTRVRHVWQTGVKPVRRLTTLHGLQVTLTTDHRVVRPHGLFANQAFAPGDGLAVLPEACHTPTWQAVPDHLLEPGMYIEAVEARTADPRCRAEAVQIAERLLPLRGDRLLAMAELVGRLFGAGRLDIQSRPSQPTPDYTVHMAGSHAELAAVNQWLEWLGLPVGRIMRSPTAVLGQNMPAANHACLIQQQSVPLFTLFELLEVPAGNGLPAASTLPAWVLHGHALVRRAFLRGLLGARLGRIDTDASIAPSLTYCIDSACLTDLTHGRHWMQQVGNLLADSGIATTYAQTELDAATVQITLGLLGGPQLYPKLAAIGFAFHAEQTAHLNALLHWQWIHTAPEGFDPTHRLYQADGHLFWDSLASIEPLGEEPVYDLEVAADSHLVVAGGIQVSNCIYGERQFGVEDQGWVAHFVIAAQLGRPISIYGDGKQVRDILYITDLIDAYELALEHIDVAAGKIYNVGGGPANTLSIWAEFAPILSRLAGQPIMPAQYGDWRPGDQPVFVCDVSKIAHELGWQPRVSVEQGIEQLWNWVGSNRHLFE